MAAALSFGFAWAVSAVLAYPVAAMLSPGLKAVNHRGDAIPASLGIVLLLAVLGALGFPVLAGWAPTESFSGKALWLSLVCLAGLVDDAAGNHGDRGFRGHFTAAFQGRLTSGAFKVIIILSAGLSLLAPLELKDLVLLGILVLAVNLFNQLDLRPGRALKASLLVFLVFVPGGSSVAAAGGGGALGLLAGDLKGRHMLGDSGANLLGALAGLVFIESLGGIWLVLTLIFLLLGNALGEFASLSRLIENNRILNWLDKLGR